MSEDYTQDQADAREMITEAGELVVVIMNSSTADPAKPWDQVNGAPTQYADTPVCYIPDNSAEWRAYMKGADVPVGAALAYTPGDIPFDLKLAHKIQSPSRGELRIESFDKIAPAGLVLMYILRLTQ